MPVLPINWTNLLKTRGGFSSPEYQAIYNAMDVKPDADVAEEQNIRVGNLVDAGVWAKLKGLFFQTPSNEQASTLNWITPADNTLVKQLSTSYNNTLGFKGNSADSSYMDMDFNPSSDGSDVYTNDAASIFGFLNTEVAEDHTFIFGYSNGGSLADPATGVVWRGGSWQGKVNEGTGGYIEFFMPGRNAGMPVFVRIDDDTLKCYFNGQLQNIESGLANGTALLNDQFQVFRNKATGLNQSDNGFGCLGYGGLLTDADVAVLHTEVRGYLEFIGATGEAQDATTLVDIDFEGATQLENGYWLSIVGGFDLNNTTTPITGTQSLLVPTSGSGALGFPKRAGTSTVYFKAKFSDATPSAHSTFMNGSKVDPAVAADFLFSLRLSTAGLLRLFSGGIGWSEGGTTLSDDTVYNIWIDFTTGTGANAICNLYLSATSTKPGSPEITITTSDETELLNYLSFSCTANMADYRVDDLLITNT